MTGNVRESGEGVYRVLLVEGFYVTISGSGYRSVYVVITHGATASGSKAIDFSDTGFPALAPPYYVDVEAGDAGQWTVTCE